MEKNACFPATIVYMQLLDGHAISCWKESFTRKGMRYYLSIYVYI